ncbi:HAD-IIB family hydrolase [Allochromatium palmeri]|uniref:HAD-IIB family hydrolase n=1 Tax=Allochromatium palmeri TaxID=231048 RepID=A0A6N8EHX0_9GAMM|nr:HAD-IIB family hydrolase [Allochromatium palmeri]MTW21924.1 HAD-IIB family hydrolase [Allochromatium palmeri]
MSRRPLLLCTDLDRTLIPNGREPESPESRPWLRRLVAEPDVTLVYVTGRHRALVEEAIAEYDLPVPDYMIGDVGTSLHAIVDGAWERVSDWETEIGVDWAGPADIAGWLADVEGLRPQEAEKQGAFKLSYYTPADLDPESLRTRIRECLEAHETRANLIWSIDEAAGVGLLDILPANASKRHAIEFLICRIGCDLDMALFAGDSGNDLEVLVSPVRAILVANAHPDVRETAIEQSRVLGLAERLYCAQGGWRGLNGNYGAGILEGIAHFRPDLADRIG